MEITAELVRDLVRDQHPDLADRPVRLGARGWDNQLWRLGDDLAVRLPWATGSADELLRKEYVWLPDACPASSAADPGTAAIRRALRTVPSAMAHHHLDSGHARRPEPRHACCGRGRIPGHFPDGSSPTRPRRRTRRSGPWRAAGRPSEGVARGLTSATERGLITTRTPSAPSGTTRSPRLNGRARRYGSTPTCTRPTSSPPTVPSAA